MATNDDEFFFGNPKSTERLHPWTDKPAHYIDVKQELTAKEEQHVRGVGVPHMLVKQGTEKDKQLTDEQRAEHENKMGLDMGRMKLVRAAYYIVGWSLMRNGAPLVINEHTIGALSPSAFDAIDKALDAHKERVDAAKKIPTSDTTPTSTEVSA